ncbi:MAG: AsmA family protein [Deltaproteobacteria bacterium]|nr:AsmA family protein [Deltaproteobacteria bacterium]
MAVRKTIRWVVISIVAVFGLLVLTAAILPFVIDVDKYRQKLVEVGQEHLNGKLELGKLSLSLWGQVKVQVDGFALSDKKGHKVVAAKDVYFHIPFLSILSGAPMVTFRLQRPELVIVKDASGKMNVASLVKELPKETKQPTDVPKAEAPKKSQSLPGMVTKARLGIEMREAQLSYRDQGTGVVSQVKDLNLVIKDLSLSRPMSFEMWANLDTKVGKTLGIRGMMRIDGKGEPKFEGREFKQSSFTVKGDFSDLEISMPGTFEKKKGVPAILDGSFIVTTTSATIEKLFVKFHNAEINAQGRVSNLGSSSPDSEPRMELQIKSNEIALRPWSELVPMLKDYELGGNATLSAQINGTPSNPSYQATLNGRSITAKAPHLKAQPQLDALVKVSTDRVDELTVTFKAPGNDLRVKGQLVSFTKPTVTLTAQSSGLDLDQLIDFPKAPAKTAPSKTDAKGGGPSAKAPSSDYDALLAPLKENKMAASASATAHVDIAFIKAYGVKMAPIAGRLVLRNLTASLEAFRMGLWDGTLKCSSFVDLKPKAPSYKLKAEVAGLDLQQAVASQFEKFKNTLLGKASFTMDATGSSFNPEPATRNLHAKGNMTISNVTFATLDIGRVAVDAINQTVRSLQSKYPQVGSGLPTPKSIESKYDSVSSDYSIANGVFTAPNFFAKAVAQKGIDFKGHTTVGLIDYSLKANWEVIDTYNLTKLRDHSPEISGVRIEHIFAENNNPVKLPVQVSGTLFSPSVSYVAVPEALGKVALGNIGKALEGKAKAELRKKAEEQIKQATGGAPAPVQDALKKIFGN